MADQEKPGWMAHLVTFGAAAVVLYVWWGFLHPEPKPQRPLPPPQHYQQGLRPPRHKDGTLPAWAWYSLGALALFAFLFLRGSGEDEAENPAYDEGKGAEARALERERAREAAAKKERQKLQTPDVYPDHNRFPPPPAKGEPRPGKNRS